ncbi:hypothetical protein BDY19DRAFT_928326 [Irpex rosettiformis]|uniref:Uncharacterized protein n=1 Tax=Irpex rosettiformis TaxID=378272 RepID=A0ACB8UCQ1_9APHY|nr:hypothetical protein BDY19DRAFT_928326 [Irpex rosettiformis]
MRSRHPSRSFTVYSTYTAQRDQATQGEARDTLSSPEWSKLLADALKEHDDDEIAGCCDDIDTLLTFAGLFSAAVTAFNVETYKMLQQDSGTLSTDILLHISQQLASTPSGPVDNPTVGAYAVPLFQPSGSAVRINVLWFASLVFSLIAASLSILVRQWLKHYLSGKYSNPEELEGLKRWRVFDMVALLPVLLHIALILFFIGLGEFLLALDTVVGILVTSLIASWLVLYAMGTITPALLPGCPYITPLTSHGIHSIRRRMWQLWSRFHQNFTGKPRKLSKYYNFPGDEMGVRRDTTKDLPALVTLDSLFMDDAFVDEVIRFCLRRLNGPETFSFLQHFLRHRRALVFPTDSDLSSDPSPRVDFTRISTRALVATADILYYKLQQALGTSTSAEEVLKPWALGSMEYIFAALHHCSRNSRDPGPSTAANTAQLLRGLSACGRPALQKMLLFFSRYHTIMEHWRLDDISTELIRDILESAKELIETDDSTPLDLCSTLLMFVDKWTRVNEDRSLSHILNEQPFSLLPITLSSIAVALEQGTDRRLPYYHGAEARNKARNSHQMLQILTLNSASPICQKLQDVLGRISGIHAAIPQATLYSSTMGESLEPGLPVAHADTILGGPYFMSPLAMDTTPLQDIAPQSPDIVVVDHVDFTPPWVSPSLSHQRRMALRPIPVQQTSFSPSGGTTNSFPSIHVPSMVATGPTIPSTTHPSFPPGFMPIKMLQSTIDHNSVVPPSGGTTVPLPAIPLPPEVEPAISSPDTLSQMTTSTMSERLTPTPFERPVEHSRCTWLVPAQGFRVLDYLNFESCEFGDCPQELSGLDVSGDDWKVFSEHIQREWMEGDRTRLDVVNSDAIQEWNDQFFSKRGVRLAVRLGPNIGSTPSSSALALPVISTPPLDERVVEDGHSMEICVEPPETEPFEVLLMPLEVPYGQDGDICVDSA